VAAEDCKPDSTEERIVLLGIDGHYSGEEEIGGKLELRHCEEPFKDLNRGGLGKHELGWSQRKLTNPGEKGGLKGRRVTGSWEGLKKKKIRDSPSALGRRLKKRIRLYASFQQKNGEVRFWRCTSEEGGH